MATDWGLGIAWWHVVAVGTVTWWAFLVTFDAERMRFTTDLSPNVRALVALSVVPLLNVLVGALYVAGRWWHRRTADPDAEPTLPGRGGGRPARRRDRGRVGQMALGHSSGGPANGSSLGGFFERRARRERAAGSVNPFWAVALDGPGTSDRRGDGSGRSRTHTGGGRPPRGEYHHR